MKLHLSFHTPIFVWLFLAGLFFAGFKIDGAKINHKIALPHSPFENYIDSLYKISKLEQSHLSRLVFEKAMVGFFNIKGDNNQALKKNIISIIDFTKKSSEKRLWIIDLSKAKLIYYTLVAHGKNTGDQYATCFSNDISSDQSSLGFYLTGEKYMGKHGLSLALDGIDKGFNDHARQRGVVIHSADYVSNEFIQAVGRLGRSFGCPALCPDIAPDVINSISDGSCLFIYYPDKIYEKTTVYYDSANAEKIFKKESPISAALF